MYRVYSCLVYEHDLRLIVFALLLCALASFTSLALLQRGLIATRHWRATWVVASGIVTGIGIWATHFTAMLAYTPGLPISFSPRTAVGAIIVAILLSILGWLVGFGWRKGCPALGGAIVGLGLTGAHYLDMTAMNAGGLLIYSPDLIAVSIGLGVALCTLAGWLLGRKREERAPVAASTALSTGILLLHFIGMASVTILPVGGAATRANALSLDALGGLVVAATIAILSVALAIALYDKRLARQAAADNRRVVAVLDALRQSEEHYRYSVELNPQIPWTADPKGNIVETSRRWQALTGLTEAETLDGGWVASFHQGDLAAAAGAWTQSLKTGERFDGRYRVCTVDGSYHWFRARAAPRLDADGAILRWYGTLEDIQTEVEAEDALRWRAHHDELTGLANRTLFKLRLSEALAQAHDGPRTVGLVMLNLDNFKAINDSRGHAAGDALLMTIAGRLAAAAGESDTVARLSGDEFAIVLPDLAGDATEAAIRTLLRNVGIERYVSVGAALWPRDGSTADDLLRSADLALSTAKSEHRGAVRFYDSGMRAALDARAAMLTRARVALRDEQIIPFYQPKIVLATGELAGFEALLRWHDPARGIQLPQGIEAAFEDAELGARLTDRMIERVVADVRRWRDGGFDCGKIAINCSMADFLRGDFADRFLESLHKAGIPPDRFELEVTESVFIGRVAESVDRTLKMLNAAGMTIALDDFGTGYASLTHLSQFPVDVIKIDRSFVSKLTDATDDNSAIVGAVLGLAKRLGIITVAEGVETAIQAERLLADSCTLGQGYLFSRAAPRAPRAGAGRYRAGPLAGVRRAAEGGRRSGLNRQSAFRRASPPQSGWIILGRAASAARSGPARPPPTDRGRRRRARPARE